MVADGRRFVVTVHRLRLVQSQPRRHVFGSSSSRHGMTRACFEITASISTSSTGAPGGSGSMTFVTRKCFSLLRGSTAVHLVCYSFFGLNALDAVGVIATPLQDQSEDGPPSSR